MASNTTNIHRLQQAINKKGYKILYSTSQFFSIKQNRPVTTYQIRQAEVDEDTGKTHSVELFKSTSQLQILLFLRDFWYEINGWEIPTDNPQWEEIKAKLKAKGEE